MGLFDALDVSASGLTAERLRMDTIANNLANANSTRRADGEPVPCARSSSSAQRGAQGGGTGGASFATFGGFHGCGSGGGVQARRHRRATRPPGKKVYDPGNPDADRKGYVTMPNVNPVTEMVDLITATRAYEADTTAIKAVEGMAQHAPGRDPLMTPAERDPERPRHRSDRARRAGRRPPQAVPARRAARRLRTAALSQKLGGVVDLQNEADAGVAGRRDRPVAAISRARRSPSRRRRSRSISSPRSATRPLTRTRTSCGCRSSAGDAGRPTRHRPARLGWPPRRRRHRDRHDRGGLLPRDVGGPARATCRPSRTSTPRQAGRRAGGARRRPRSRPSSDGTERLGARAVAQRRRGARRDRQGRPRGQRRARRATSCSTSLGMSSTDFQQNVAMKRALEGELANQIQNIAGVSDATVNLAMPQQTLFLADQKPPTASVLLTLSGGGFDDAAVRGMQRARRERRLGPHARERRHHRPGRRPPELVRRRHRRRGRLQARDRVALLAPARGRRPADRRPDARAGPGPRVDQRPAQPRHADREADHLRQDRDARCSSPRRRRTLKGTASGATRRRRHRRRTSRATPRRRRAARRPTTRTRRATSRTASTRPSPTRRRPAGRPRTCSSRSRSTTPAARLRRPGRARRRCRRAHEGPDRGCEGGRGLPRHHAEGHQRGHRHVPDLGLDARVPDQLERLERRRLRPVLRGREELGRRPTRRW